jgi:hypothetical protein
MTPDQEVEQLMDLTGLESKEDAMDYILMHYNAFPAYLVSYCEKMLGGESNEIS